MNREHDFFFAAIEGGDSIRVRSLIEDELVDCNSSLVGVPALVHSTSLGHSAIVDILLRAGAHVDACDSKQRTACHVAAEQGHADVLARLLAHTPDLGRRDVFGYTPFEVAIRYRQERIVIMLIEARALFASPMLLCVLDGGVVVRELSDDECRTPLHVAATAHISNPAAMRMLVDDVCGIDVDARNSLGCTSLHLAAANDCGDQSRWLIDAGADIDAVADDGHTPLHDSVDSADIVSMVYLLAAGANVHAKTVAGETVCFYLAARCDEYDDDNAFDELDGGDYIVPMMYALMAAGADVDAPNQSGVTARQLLARRGLALSDSAELARTWRIIAEERLNFVRDRALQVCVGLAALRIDALQMCEILVHACGPVAPHVAFHQWWNIATVVKHKHFRKQEANCSRQENQQ